MHSHGVYDNRNPQHSYITPSDFPLDIHTYIPPSTFIPTYPLDIHTLVDFLEAHAAEVVALAVETLRLYIEPCAVKVGGQTGGCV